MNWQTELVLSSRVVLAALLGALIGLEREMRGRGAGIRTFAAVTVGACTFGIISHVVVNGADTTRIAAQVVSGIGFLGAGVILRARGHISGLTTAATLWVSAAVGVALGFGLYLLAIVTAVICMLILLFRYLPGLRNRHEEDAPQIERQQAVSGAE